MATPPTTTDIDNAVATNALGPKRVQVGNESVEQFDAADQIALANHQAALGAAKQPHFGVRYTQLIPGGTG